MALRKTGLFLLLGSFLPCLPAAEGPAYVSGRLLVGLKEGIDAGKLARTLQLHRAGIRKHIPQNGVAVLDVPEEYGDALMQSLKSTGLFEFVERDHYAHTAAETPNDPKYPSQWHLPKIGAPDAWALTTGANVLVAVIDSGVDANHADLKAHLVPGWNFRTSGADTDDQVGHGTAVTGTIAATSDNGIGVASLNWSARIMPLAVVAPDESATYSDMASALVYAADHGARIVNISIGGPNGSAALQSAVDYAWSKGVLIFASAMNDAKATPNYPAACHHVVAVAATDSTDRLAYFSNYGPWITLSAPGANILTTSIGSGYGFWNGTSFASPIAAGVAALVLSADPALSNANVLDILKETADPVGDANVFGAGRVNAGKAVAVAYRLAHPPQIHPPQFRRHPR